MGLSPKQVRAVQHFIKSGPYRPELSSYPLYRFTNKDTNEVVTHNISTLVDWYVADRERERRQSAQEKRETKGRNESNVRFRRE